MDKLGSFIHILDNCNSTNSEAKRWAELQRLKHGEVIFTHCQKAGRGQRDNIWKSEAYQNLTFSIFLDPMFLKIKEQFDLNIIISLALLQTAGSLIPTHLKSHLQIKWPNDLYFKDKKMAGILIESVIKGKKIDFTIVGIGMNINERIQLPSAISLYQITNSVFVIIDVLEKVLKNIQTCMEQFESKNYQTIIYKYLNHLYNYQQDSVFKDVQSNHYFYGQIIGVKRQGEVQIQTATGLKTFSSGQIQFV